jgi:hypothetical protein
MTYGWRVPLLLVGIVLSISHLGWRAHANLARQLKSNGSQSSVSDSVKLMSNANAPDASLIIPGKSVGTVRLGDSQKQFWTIFPKLDPNNDEVTYPCPNGNTITELHGLGLHALSQREVVAYLQGGHIFEIMSPASQFHTGDGITAGSKPEMVREKYPGLEAFWLANIRDLISQSRDFVYWVDPRRGIAFEFYYDQSIKERRVYSITVFEPGKNFIPRGCLWYPKNRHKLPSYALEPPRESVQIPDFTISVS